MSRRRKKTSLVGRIVLIMLLALLAVLIVLRYFSRSPETLSEETAPATNAPAVADTPAPTPETEALTVTATPAPTATAGPTAIPAAISTATPEPAEPLQVVEELEIIVPEDMDSDGF